ncbi:DUF6919 domain-containing protein [Streptomyces alboniger]|uniref:DUF6919 domain-containing protein n=1 Tax=Streptomyces alboniger TaxID=132473 RepID=UPI003CCC719F
MALEAARPRHRSAWIRRRPGAAAAGAHSAYSTGVHGPDRETGPLAPVLCEANRGGFLAEGSRPPDELAVCEGGLWHQRAFVSGSQAAALAAMLNERVHRAGLISGVYRPAGRPVRDGREVRDRCAGSVVWIRTFVAVCAIGLPFPCARA